MAGNEYESLRALVQSCTQLRQEIERLTLERDEARRKVCALDADTVEDQREYAAQRGWDCFGGKHDAPPA